MASRKLSQHTAITGANVNPNADYIEILDVSDTTDAASGTNKKILPNQLLIAIGAEPAKGADDNYVTDAEKVVIGNTSGTNTGDNAVNSNYSGLAAEIDSEEAARVAADSALSTLISNEASTRSSADSTLQSNINSEASTRSTADSTLQTNIDAKVTKNADITGATKTKVTYDAKGLVTSGTDATTSDISEGSNLYHTTERAQDAVGAMINDSLVYDDATPALGINLAKANVFTADQSVPDDAYDATTWNGNMEVPTKNAIRDKIETMGGGGSSSAQVVSATLGSTQTNYAIGGLDTSSGVPTILYVTPSTSFSFQSLNLTGVEDGKTIIIINSSVYNASAARAFIIENNNGASGTKFLYANNGVPMIMTPGGMSRFIYTGGYLRLENSTCFGDSPNACFDYFDDLLWTPVTSGSMLPAWKFGSGGTSSIATNTSFTIPTDINPQGVLGISTGSASAVGSLLLQQQNLLQGGRGFATFLGRATSDTTLSTGSDTWFDFLGFMNGDGSSVSNGVYWKYDAATVTNWFPATNLNGTESTVTGEGPTVNVNQMPYLGIFINGDWTNVEYFYSTDGITWTWCATALTANIPIASNRLFSVGASRRRTAGTAARILAIDILAYTYKALRTT